MHPIITLFTGPRARSFYWRTGDMAFAGFVDFLMTSFTNGDVNMPVWAVGLLGLALGEVTKLLNAKAK
jgi:hypothetical protein